MIIAPFDKMQTRRGRVARERALNKVICRYADRARRKAAAERRAEGEREGEKERGERKRERARQRRRKRRIEMSKKV